MPHGVGQRLQARDLGVLSLGQLRLPLFLAVAGSPVLGVRAAVLHQLAFVEVQHVGDGLVEQHEVVAHHDESAAVRPEETHEPRLGVGIEVVGGLVEQEQVAAGEQDASQLDAASLPSREDVHRHVDAVGRQPEAGTDATNLGLGPVAAGGAVVVFGAAVTNDVALRGVLLDLETELLETHDGVVERAPRQHVAERGRRRPRAAMPRPWVLGEIAEGTTAADRAAGRRRLAAQHLQQAGLAGTVATDQADLLAGAHDQRGVLDHGTPTHLDGQLAGLDHGPIIPPPGPRPARICWWKGGPGQPRDPSLWSPPGWGESDDSDTRRRCS